MLQYRQLLKERKKTGFAYLTEEEVEPVLQTLERIQALFNHDTPKKQRKAKPEPAAKATPAKTVTLSEETGTVPAETKTQQPETGTLFPDQPQPKKRRGRAPIDIPMDTVRQLLREGHSLVQIASELGINIHTLRAHVHRVGGAKALKA